MSSVGRKGGRRSTKRSKREGDRQEWERRTSATWGAGAARKDQRVKRSDRRNGGGECDALGAEVGEDDARGTRAQLDSRSGPGQRDQFRRGVGGARQHSDAVGHLGHLCLELFFDGLHFHHGGGGVAAAASRARCRLWSSGAREKEETRKRRGRDEREKPEVVSGEKTNDREVCRDVGRRRSRS